VPSIVETRPFTADLGAATATGFLLVADPIEDSIVRGTLRVLGIEDVSFEARVDGPPFEVTVLGVTVIIRFDIALRQFIGSSEHETSGGVSQKSAIFVGLDCEV
jgi:hypothetical protein